MSARTCLVTGATGFIGAALARRLRANGVRVRGLARSARPPAADELVVADLAEQALDPRWLADVDTVYHLAAKTHDLAAAGDAESDYRRVNVEGTRRLLAAAAAHPPRRLVFASSVKAQGEGGPLQLDESGAPRPTTAYGRSKLAAERLVSDAAARGGYEAVCLRFPLVYGPGQKGNLQRMLAAIDRERFPPPPDNGNRRSMLHVENAVDALTLAAAHPAAAGCVYLVTDARPYSTRELYDWAREALGKRRRAWSVPEWAFRGLAAAGDGLGALLGRRVGFDSEAYDKLLGSAWYSAGKIARELGYRPARDLRGAMAELVADYRARQPAGGAG